MHILTVLGGSIVEARQALFSLVLEKELQALVVLTGSSRGDAGTYCSH